MPLGSCLQEIYNKILQSFILKQPHGWNPHSGNSWHLTDGNHTFYFLVSLNHFSDLYIYDLGTVYWINKPFCTVDSCWLMNLVILSDSKHTLLVCFSAPDYMHSFLPWAIGRETLYILCLMWRSSLLLGSTPLWIHYDWEGCFSCHPLDI